MRQHFSDKELTPARLRMARIPEAAELIDNAISRAPGFMIGNVIVMAGVPRIMQVMLDAVLPRLAKGRPMLLRSVRIDAPEGDVAPGLSELQSAHPEVQIGSYPYWPLLSTRCGSSPRSASPRLPVKRREPHTAGHADSSSYQSFRKENKEGAGTRPRAL